MNARIEQYKLGRYYYLNRENTWNTMNILN